VHGHGREIEIEPKKADVPSTRPASVATKVRSSSSEQDGRGTRASCAGICRVEPEAAAADLDVRTALSDDRPVQERARRDEAGGERVAGRGLRTTGSARAARGINRVTSARIADVRANSRLLVTFHDWPTG